jgi:hypothetical protein
MLLITVTTVLILSLLVKNWLWLLPGTIIHELWHWSVGFVTLAGPNNLTVRPENTAYGRVWFSNLNNLNTLPTALAPLLTLPLVWFLWPWINTVARTGYEIVTIGWIVGTAIAMSWPSQQDWQLVFDHWWGSLLWAVVIFWLTF